MKHLSWVMLYPIDLPALIGQTLRPVPSSSSLPWSDWRPVPGLPSLSERVVHEWFDGGQSFRWHSLGHATWGGQWAGCAARIRRTDSGHLEWQAPLSLLDITSESLPHYLALATPFESMTDALPWRSDAQLAAAIEAFPRLRLLRQPFGETLLGFLCSATKQIVQIKQMMELIAAHHGTTVATGLKRLPTWEELADVSESSLRKCLLGFRARYVHETAQFLARRPGWLDEVENLPYPEARLKLCELPGVGEKVADCILLYGGGKMESFPVDVWVLRTMATRYGLVGWKPEQVALFGRTHFGPAAGLAQQYFFAYERDLAKKAKKSAS